MSELRNKEARKDLKVLIVNDIEGISGINHWHQIRYGYEEFTKFGRIQVTEDVNAAVRGLRAAGATDIRVADCHGSGGPNKNIISEKLEQGVELFQEKTVPERLKQAVDKSIDAAVFIGFHAMADTKDGFLRHTVTLEPRIRINGNFVGETGLTAYAISEYGIPVIMVTGDQALVREASEFLPGIETVQVKSSRDCRSTDCLPPSEARRLIEIVAKRALSRIDEFQPVQLIKPIKIDVSFPKKEHVDLCETIPRAERSAEKTVSYTADDWNEANKFVRTTIRLAGQLAIGALLQKAGKLEGAEKVLHEWEEDLVNEWLS
ncbi:MAG: M55 family metallopeptidase [Candidatus Bathyarchaeota archaeon]|jgi:D-amino peptidase